VGRSVGRPELVELPLEPPWVGRSVGRSVGRPLEPPWVGRSVGRPELVELPELPLELPWVGRSVGRPELLLELPWVGRSVGRPELLLELLLVEFPLVPVVVPEELELPPPLHLLAGKGWRPWKFPGGL